MVNNLNTVNIEKKSEKFRSNNYINEYSQENTYDNIDDNTEIPNFLSHSGSRDNSPNMKVDYGYNNISNNNQPPLNNTQHTNNSYTNFDGYKRISAPETTRNNFENADDSMDEINMISKVKELTESASRMDLKSTPTYNLEKRLKEIKKMMNTVCAKYMNKKNECKNYKEQLTSANTETEKFKQLYQAESMRSEAINGNENNKFNDLISKNANKDVAVERLNTEIRKLKNDNANQAKTYEALIQSHTNNEWKLNNTVQSKDKTIDQLNEDLITINKELKNLQSMRNVYDNKTSTFNEEVEFKNNRIKTVEARNKDLSEKNMLLQQQLDDTLYKANNLTSEYKTIVNDLESQSKIVLDFQN